MSITKREANDIAVALSAHQPILRQGDDFGEYLVRFIEWESICRTMASQLNRLNPSVDKATFVNTCGVNEREDLKERVRSNAP